MQMKRRTLKRYRDDALESAARSHSLWQSVNRTIAEILDTAIHNRDSRQRVYVKLMKMAGPKQSGEPVALENYRIAARRIANKTDRLTLI